MVITIDKYTFRVYNLGTDAPNLITEVPEMAHARTDAGPAIAGTGTTRTKTAARNWLPFIVVVGFLAIIGTLLLALNRGIEVGSLVIRQGTGASMEPLAYDGDSLVAWVKFNLVVGETYLVRDKGQLLHKRLKEIKGDQFVFDSINQEHETTLYRVSHNQVLARVVLVLPTHFLWDGEGDVAEGRDLGITEEEKRIARLEGELAEKKEANKVERIEKRSKQLDLLHSKLVAKISTGAKPVFDGISETGLTLDQGKCWLCEVIFSKPATIKMLKVETDGRINFVHILIKGTWQEVTPNDPDQKYLLVGTPIEGFKVSIGPPLGDTELRISEIRCYH